MSPSANSLLKHRRCVFQLGSLGLVPPTSGHEYTALSEGGLDLELRSRLTMRRGFFLGAGVAWQKGLCSLRPGCLLLSHN